MRQWRRDRTASTDVSDNDRVDHIDSTGAVDHYNDGDAEHHPDDHRAATDDD